MANTSGNKGSTFERSMVKHLSELYNDQSFSRTPSSGALVGLSNFAKNMGLDQNVRQTLGSDLIVPDWFNYAVECKWYKDKPNHSAIIHGKESNLDLWLGETCFDAINFEKVPLLFFKTNNCGVFAALPNVIGNDLDVQSKTVYHSFTVISLQQFDNNVNKIAAHSKAKHVMVIQMLKKDKFVKHCLDTLHKKKSPQ